MKRAAVVAIALGVGGLAVALAVLGGGYRLAPPAPLEVSSWEIYSDPDVGWSLRFPPGWLVQEDDASCPGQPQIVVTNIGADLEHPELDAPPGGFACTDLWDMRDLPAGFVVIELEVPGDVAPGPRGSQRTLPLSLEDAHRGNRSARFGVPHGLVLAVYFDQSHTYYVRARFGPEASRHDRAVAELIVGSMRFKEAGRVR